MLAQQKILGVIMVLSIVMISPVLPYIGVRGVFIVAAFLAIVAVVFGAGEMPIRRWFLGIAVMAFLLSSAVTDPEMIAVTAATLGWQFALGKTLAALGIGILGGAVTLLLVRGGSFPNPTRQSKLLQKLIPQSHCDTATTVKWYFWRDADRLRAFQSSAASLFKLVILWLSLAFMAEYFMQLYLPENMLTGFVGRDNPFSVPIAAIIGAPLYLDGYAALPFVRRVTPPRYARTRTGSVETEGDAIHLADALRDLGLDGTGVKVGIIDALLVIASWTLP